MKIKRKVLDSIIDDGNLRTMSQKLSFAFIPPVIKNGQRLDMKFELRLENIPHGTTQPAERITFRTAEGRKIAEILQNVVAAFLLYPVLTGKSKEDAEHALLWNIQSGIALANQKLREWGIGKQETLEHWLEVQHG